MKHASWILINIGLLIAFPTSILFNIDWLYNISIFLLWFTAICGSLLLLIPTEKLSEIEYTPSISSRVDVTFDIIMTLVIVGFGHYTLGTFYVLHIMGLQHFRTSVASNEHI